MSGRADSDMLSWPDNEHQCHFNGQCVWECVLVMLMTFALHNDFNGKLHFQRNNNSYTTCLLLALTCNLAIDKEWINGRSSWNAKKYEMETQKNLRMSEVRWLKIL